MIVLDFNLHVFTYPHPKKTITNINELIFVGKCTILNENTKLPTLLERALLYYN